MTDAMRNEVARAIHGAMLGGGEYDQQYVSPSGDIHTAAHVYDPLADAAIAAVITNLIADTVWMDAWARDPDQQRRMSDSRKTIVDWLTSKISTT